MNTSLLGCPRCGEDIVDEASTLVCSKCGKAWPIENGVPRFTNPEYTESFSFQWKRFPTTQLDSASGRRESEETFVAKTAIDPRSLEGASVLDVGCGMGRFARVCADHGAEVVGVDMSAAVEVAADNLPGATIVQADLFDLPLKESSFDVIYSIGVLHHTPDTRRAFLSLPRFLKPGGVIAIWVYSAEPVDRLASGLKYLYRRITPKLDQKLLLGVSRIAVPAYRIHTRKYLGFFSRKLLPTSMHPDPEWRVLDTFDDYSPKYRWRHTYDEVLSWFAEARLVDLRALGERVAVRGRKTTQAEDRLWDVSSRLSELSAEHDSLRE